MPPHERPPRTAEAAASGGRGEDRILTVPNAVTLGRLACVPLFLWLLLGRGDRGAAAVLLAALGVTDWVDGYLARRLGQVSNLGKALDPVADRILLVVGVVAILVDGSVPVAVAALTIVRESLVAAVAVALALLGARRIEVTWSGKAGTFAMMVAYPLFLAGRSRFSWAEVGEVLAWVVVVPGLVLSYLSAARYVPQGRHALADSRANRTRPAGEVVGR
ncbi:MAG: CDP-alcohol phosphatidyltransferase family protein [Acidimicrobiales bacterium]